MNHPEFAKEVMREIHWLDAVSEPAAEDSALVQAISKRIHASLVKAKVCYWDTGSIPDEVGQQLIRYMACFVGPSFGKSITDAGMNAAQTKEYRYSELCTAAKTNFLGVSMRSDFPGLTRRGFVFETGE